MCVSMHLNQQEAEMAKGEQHKRVVPRQGEQKGLVQDVLPVAEAFALGLGQGAGGAWVKDKLKKPPKE